MLPLWRLIPIRPKARIDAAPVFRQRRNRLAVLVIERDVQRLEIGLLALGARGLRDRRHPILIEQPFQRDLRCARIVLAADLRKLLVGGNAALRQRAIGDQRDVVGGRYFRSFVWSSIT